MGSKNPRLPGDNFQYVGAVEYPEQASHSVAREAVVALAECKPCETVACEKGTEWSVHNQSGFQPTVEPTGFQPVVIQLRAVSEFMRTFNLDAARSRHP